MFAMKVRFVAKNNKVSLKLWKTIARLSIKVGQEQSKIGLTSNFCVALALPLLPVGSVDPIPFHLLPLGSPKSMAIIMGWTWQQRVGPGMCFSSSRVWLCGWVLWLTLQLALLADTSSLGAVWVHRAVSLLSLLPWMLFSLSHTYFIFLFFFCFFGGLCLWTNFVLWKHLIQQQKIFPYFSVLVTVSLGTKCKCAHLLRKVAAAIHGHFQIKLLSLGPSLETSVTGEVVNLNFHDK